MKNNHLISSSLLRRFCTLIIFFIPYVAYAQNAKTYVAVSNLVGQGIEPSSTTIISDRIRNALFKQSDFIVLDRNVMQEILSEQGFRLNGCTSDVCAIEIGQLLGVSHIVMGTVKKQGSLFTIDVRLIEVVTGKIVFTESVDCDCPVEEVQTASVSTIADKIAGYIKTNCTTHASEPEIVKKLQVSPDETATKQNIVEEQKPLEQVIVSQPKKKNPALKITFGTIAVAAAGAGVAFEMLLRGTIEEDAEIRNEYRSIPGNSLYEDYNTRLSNNIADARSYEKLRNICYAVSGLGLGVFVVTIWF